MKWIKNILLCAAVFFVSLGITSTISSSLSGELENWIVAVALTVLVVFVWNKISKRYLDKKE